LRAEVGILDALAVHVLGAEGEGVVGDFGVVGVGASAEVSVVLDFFTDISAAVDDRHWGLAVAV
jgi:hypothetical protein